MELGCSFIGPKYNGEGREYITIIDLAWWYCRKIEAHEMAMSSKSKGTVVVVDDDASLLRALRRLLLTVDFDVQVFGSAEAFLAGHLPAGKVCLLLDVYLPGMSGIDLCKTVAASRRKLPTILMSARDDETTQRRVREAGAIATLYKPFDEDVLLNTVARALGTK
jgi:FixJ family two-component response regulator